MNEAEVKRKLQVYMSAFLESYQRIVDERYQGIISQRDNLGRNMDLLMMPFHGRQLGNNTALSVLYSEDRTYIYSLVRKNEDFERVVWASEVTEFQTETFKYDRQDIKENKVREYLGVAAEPLGAISAHLLFIGQVTSFDDEDLVRAGKDHGAARAHNDARDADRLLSRIRPLGQALKERQSFKQEFIGLQSLSDGSITAQQRGNKFEDLVRRVLDHHGWNIKEIKKVGEQIDFTGIFEGNHILGEIKWVKKPAEAEQMRNFMARLASRPQSIGLFVSYSGYSKGALDVIRRDSHTIVVTFDQSDIESIFLKDVNPGKLFSEKLRDRYDYSFSY